MKPLRSLELLFQGYLNLDWIDDYPDPWDAIDDFAGAEPEDAVQLPHDVEALLDAVQREEDLRRIVISDLGSGYLPESDGWTYRDWLRAVANRVSQNRGQ
jgi:hypothetical protein